MGAVEERLAELGLSVPDVAKPVAVYIAVAAQRQPRLHVRPAADARRRADGSPARSVGRWTPTRRYECARQCGLNAIAAVKAEVGDLDLVKQVVKVVVFVASTPDFTGQPGVANGVSELLGTAFGDAGVHARSAVGVAALPLDAPVEVELVVEI